MSARYIVGDVRKVLATLPDESVDLVLSSPPFLGLRSYLPPDSPDKDLEMGSEATPGEFVDALLDVVEDCARVLAPHGSLCLELGDTYAGLGGAGGDYGTKDPGHVGLREGQPKFGGSALSERRTRNANRGAGERRSPRRDAALGILPPGRDAGGGVGWPLDKSLCMVPELVRLSLAYGRNPLTGRETPRWRIRNVIRWERPNPPVGALADKFRPATSEMLIACKDRRRFFDLDAVRHAPADNRDRGDELTNWPGHRNPRHVSRNPNPAGAPPLDWWECDEFPEQGWVIPTEGFSGAHFATWPRKLLIRPILAMCPERVCTVCGKPSERVVEAHRRSAADDSTRHKATVGANPRSGFTADVPERGWEYDRTTTGWTDCGHDSWRPGVVLDPFAGSGTTLQVAFDLGRDSIGIDLDERNVALVQERFGLFAGATLAIERHEKEKELRA